MPCIATSASGAMNGRMYSSRTVAELCSTAKPVPAKITGSATRGSRQRRHAPPASAANASGTTGKPTLSTVRSTNQRLSFSEPSSATEKPKKRPMLLSHSQTLKSASERR